MVSPVFKCELVTKSYGAMKAVDSLSLSAYSGEVIGIAGPNGAGKTTLFDLFSGVQKPDSGEMYLNNKLITNLGADKLCKLGIFKSFSNKCYF